MAIDFPSTPSDGQTVISGNSTYIYNATKGTWDLTTATVIGPTGPTGPTGPVSNVTGPTGPQGIFTVAATTAPTSPSSGATWFNSETGKTYVYYADGTSSQWVQIETAGPKGPPGVYTTQATAPSAPTTGDAWMNTTDGRLYIYNGTSWFEPTNNQAGPTGPSGVVSVTGPVTNSGTSTAAVIGVDSTVVITTTAQSLTNKTLSSPIFNGAALEAAYTTATGFAGYTFYVTTNGAIQYITASSTASGTVNIASTSGVALNTLMANNQSITVVLAITNGATAYYPTAWQIDGIAVTPKWSGGTAPSSGNASAIDIYTLTIIKTASATWTILANQTKFA